MITLKSFAAWETLPALPVANGGFACGQLGGKIVLLGGTTWNDNTKQWLDEIWAYDPNTKNWKSQGRLPNPLALGVMGEWKGDLIIAGGTDGQQARYEVWRMIPSFELKKIGELKKDSALAAGAVIENDLLILGGCADVTKLEGLHKGGEQFHLPQGRVSDLPSAGDLAFGIAASAAIGGELFVFAGARHDPVKQVVNLDSAWAFDIHKNKWRSLRPYPHAVRGPSAVKLDGHRILIAGGFGGVADTFSAAAFIYDIRKDTYAQTTDLPIAALVGLAQADGFVYCLGGEDKMKHRTDACFRVKADELISAAEKRVEKSK